MFFCYAIYTYFFVLSPRLFGKKTEKCYNIEIINKRPGCFMINNNLALYGAKILAELGRDLVFFPFWWYSQGLFLFVKKLLAFLNNQQKNLALFVWIKNIHKPMYGQNDWQGIMISVLMRIFQILIRSILMFFYLAIACAALLAWIFIPLVIIYQVYFQLIA